MQSVINSTCSGLKHLSAYLYNPLASTFLDEGRVPRKVQIALIAGSMYEPLYRSLEEFSATRDVSVEVGYLGDHPALNEHLASTSEPVYDLISTHTKYAPSQAHFLAPIETHV